jgi:hypothetical protein
VLQPIASLGAREVLSLAHIDPLSMLGGHPAVEVVSYQEGNSQNFCSDLEGVANYYAHFHNGQGSMDVSRLDDFFAQKISKSNESDSSASSKPSSENLASDLAPGSVEDFFEITSKDILICFERSFSEGLSTIVQEIARSEASVVHYRNQLGVIKSHEAALTIIRLCLKENYKIIFLLLFSLLLVKNPVSDKTNIFEFEKEAQRLSQEIIGSFFDKDVFSGVLSLFDDGISSLKCLREVVSNCQKLRLEEKKMLDNFDYNDAFGKVCGFVDRAQYSELGNLFRDGRLGETGYITGTIVQGVFSAHKQNAEFSQATRLAVIKLAEFAISSQAKCLSDLTRVQEERVKLLDQLTKPITDATTRITNLLIEQAGQVLALRKAWLEIEQQQPRDTARLESYKEQIRGAESQVMTTKEFQDSLTNLQHAIKGVAETSPIEKEVLTVAFEACEQAVKSTFETVQLTLKLDANALDGLISTSVSGIKKLLSRKSSSSITQGQANQPEAIVAGDAARDLTVGSNSQSTTAYQLTHRDSPQSQISGSGRPGTPSEFSQAEESYVALQVEFNSKGFTESAEIKHGLVVRQLARLSAFFGHPDCVSNKKQDYADMLKDVSEGGKYSPSNFRR